MGLSVLLGVRLALGGGEHTGGYRVVDARRTQFSKFARRSRAPQSGKQPARGRIGPWVAGDLKDVGNGVANSHGGMDRADRNANARHIQCSKLARLS